MNAPAADPTERTSMPDYCSERDVVCVLPDGGPGRIVAGGARASGTQPTDPTITPAIPSTGSTTSGTASSVSGSRGTLGGGQARPGSPGAGGTGGAPSVHR
jgi:hypothetical protein